MLPTADLVKSVIELIMSVTELVKSTTELIRKFIELIMSVTEIQHFAGFFKRADANASVTAQGIKWQKANYAQPV